MSKRGVIFGLAVLVVALCTAVMVCETVHAATASWQANSEADLAGYNIYRAEGPCATPGPFAKAIVAPKEATSIALPNPAKDGLHCHRATAFDTANNESLFSNTVEFTYNAIPPAAPQQLRVAP